MLPTTAFAAPFGFVGWTLSLPARGTCRRVSTPSQSRMATDAPDVTDKAAGGCIRVFREVRAFRDLAWLGITLSLPT